MKVLLLNGSPRKEGCTFTALSEVAKTLNHNGIDTEIFQAGNPDTDNVKAAAAKLKEADALIVGSARRAVTPARFDVRETSFSYHEMPVVSANSWNMVHGNTPAEVAQDEEGLQIMRSLGNNMAWLLKSLEAGKAAGIAVPQAEDKIKTNFIR